MPYVLHGFLQISSLCKELYIGVSQAETKLPFPRTCYSKCVSKPEGYHLNPPNHSTNIKWKNNVTAGVALQALGFYIINN